VIVLAPQRAMLEARTRESQATVRVKLAQRLNRV